jgi:nucleotide-binding universal stress UspA family protein
MPVKSRRAQCAYGEVITTVEAAMPTAIKQVLVHLDPTAGTPHRLAAARAISERQGAVLAALYAVTPSFVELPYSPEIGPSLAADLVQMDETRRLHTLQAFDKAMAEPGAIATWSQTAEFPIIGVVAQQARFADLLVLGQHAPDDEASRCIPPDFVESVLVESGRPALVIPHIGWSAPIAETIVIAWKQTAEAARAVSAAMPLLQRARRIHVLAWGDADEPAVGGHPLDLDSYLKVHEVTATWHREGAEPGELGELLLSRVFDLDADLLVMGCYGHSRAREWVLGGASRSVLQSMTLPVLMSH